MWSMKLTECDTVYDGRFSDVDDDVVRVLLE
jgi:hypothetical protein